MHTFPQADVAENRVASIRKDVERVVAESGEEKVQELRHDLVKKVSEDLEPALKGKGPTAPVSAMLEKALAGIQESSSQTDILRALLDGASNFSARVALFVVKGGAAAGWQARGFDEATVRWVVKRVAQNEYKRAQSVPGLKVTSKAFGVGRRMPVAQRYAE